MIIDEIEEAEKKAEGIISEANRKSAERIKKAKLKSYNNIMDDASKRSEELVAKSKSKADDEGKKITSSSKRTFSISPGDKKRLVSQIVNSVLGHASGKQ
ncbi:MAG: hypothetical protein ABIG39_02875 [Candidatus Micrarchaeota archaeon]